LHRRASLLAGPQRVPPCRPRERAGFTAPPHRARATRPRPRGAARAPPDRGAARPTTSPAATCHALPTRRSVRRHHTDDSATALSPGAVGALDEQRIELCGAPEEGARG